MRNTITERIDVELSEQIEKIREEANKRGLDLSKTQASKILANEYKRLKCGKLMVNLKL